MGIVWALNVVIERHIFTYSFARIVGGVSSLLRKSFVSAKSAMNNFAVGFGVPGLG